MHRFTYNIGRNNTYEGKTQSAPRRKVMACTTIKTEFNNDNRPLISKKIVRYKWRCEKKQDKQKSSFEPRSRHTSQPPRWNVHWEGPLRSVDPKFRVTCCECKNSWQFVSSWMKTRCSWLHSVLMLRHFCGSILVLSPSDNFCAWVGVWSARICNLPFFLWTCLGNWHFSPLLENKTAPRTIQWLGHTGM